GSNWPIEDIEIRVVKDRRTNRVFENSQHDGQRGRIVKVMPKRKVAIVHLYSFESEDDTLSIAWDFLEPVRPEKKQRTKIIGGEDRGKAGSLIGVDGQDGIVKLDEGKEFRVFTMNLVGKLAQ